MRKLAIALVIIAACGGNKAKPGDGNGSGSGSNVDAGPLFDAPPLATCTPTSGTNISLQKVGNSGGIAVLATSPPNDGRMFVVNEGGQIVILDNTGTPLPTPFLDVSGIANFAAGGEQGLLGLAFDPNYAFNNYFYVWYTTGPCPGGPPATAPCANVLERFTASATNLNQADPTSGQVLLSIPDFATNHNAGMLNFGPDGFLYISTGDGGSGGDPARNGQNPNALLAKILRIDPAHPANGKPYGIPTDNPYADGTMGAPEVFLMGVRNPWRWSFDRKTGDMWIADVGQNVTEELDVLVAGQQNGKNLGWSAYEANACCMTQGDKCSQSGTQQACDPTGKFFPQYSYAHATDPMTNGPRNAIIGGEVYRGSCYPGIQGTYFFSDNGAYPLNEAVLNADGTVTVTELTPPNGGWPQSPSAIHGDARGELYETTTSGDVWHIEAGP